MTQQKTSFPQRFYRRAHEADKASEEISAAGVENTRSFSAAEFHEPGEWQFKALISLDYTSCWQKARLLLYLCAGTEIAQPPSCRKRLNLGGNEACAVVMVPNISKKSMAVFKDWRMQL